MKEANEAPVENKEETKESVEAPAEAPKISGGDSLEQNEKADAIWSNLEEKHDVTRVQDFKAKTGKIIDAKIGNYLDDPKKGAEVQEAQAELAQGYFNDNGGDKDLEPAMLNMFSHQVGEILK